MKVLILGANSFIGSNFLKAIQDDSTIKISTFSRAILDSPYFNVKKIQQFTGDYNQREALLEALLEQDIVYNFISDSKPKTSWDRPVMEVERNLIPFINFLEVAQSAGVKKIVYPSSGGTVYGDQEGNIDEKYSLCPFTPYGIIKSSIEYFLEFSKKKYGINYDIYRITNPYGPNQSFQNSGVGVVARWVELVKSGKTIEIFGSGKIKKDFIYIDDLCELLKLSLKKDLNDSDVYNVSSGESVTLDEVIDAIRRATRSEVRVSVLDGLSSDNKRVQISNKKIMKNFPGFKFLPLDEGIKRMFNI